jgi:hypothetical protein
MAGPPGTTPEEQAYNKEYYERNKQLKGRNKGSSYKSGGRDRTPPVPTPAKNQAARAAATKRVKALNAKLTQLRAALAAAKAKAPKSDPNAGRSKGESEAKKKADNKEYYEKNKNEIKNDRKAESRSAPAKSGGSSAAKESSSAPASRSVEEIETAIRNTLNELKSAIAKLKSL